ncbi:MAG: DUF3638 domain-containing protein, partial [Verrucomicrobia bacterium]|nr:DUF3638 domain-containing protein [Verrucomicrobiota bacterium]
MPIQHTLDGLIGQNPDPLVQKELQRIKKDFIVYENLPSTPHYTLKDNALFEIEQYCLDVLSNTHIKKQEKEILDVAQKAPIATLDIAKRDLSQWGGTYRPLKLGELLINFAKQDRVALKRRNAALSAEDIATLYGKIGEYLQLATRKQQARRVLETVNKLKIAKEDAISDLVQELAGDLNATRTYAVGERAAFLVFEYFADILLRADQQSMISDILKDTNASVIRELIMGSGKTKVLMPLLALLRADGKHISTIIVHQAQYQSVTSDTQKILKDALDVSLHTLEFDRNSAYSHARLQDIVEELKSIRDNKEVLIITGKSLHCFLLKFIEKACEHFKNPLNPTEMTNELKLMREILGLLSSKSLPLLDEADLLLSVLHEVSFSLGKMHGPIGQEIDLITELYDILYNDEQIKQLTRIESDLKSNPAAPVLTEQ